MCVLFQGLQWVLGDHTGCASRFGVSAQVPHMCTRWQSRQKYNIQISVCQLPHICIGIGIAYRYCYRAGTGADIGTRTDHGASSKCTGTGTGVTR